MRNSPSHRSRLERQTHKDKNDQNVKHPRRSSVKWSCLDCQPSLAILGSCVCYLCIGLVNGYYKLDDYFYSYFIYHNPSFDDYILFGKYKFNLNLLSKILPISFYLMEIISLFISSFFISPKLGLLKMILLSSIIILISYSLSYAYCYNPISCIITCGIVPAFGIGIIALLPMTYLLQASFFLSQQIFNITSCNISQSAIPRLYAGKIGFYSCLMFTSFGMGLFVYDQLIMLSINPHDIKLYPDNNTNDIHGIMNGLQTSFLITGLLIFFLLITADLLIYLSSISPKSVSYDRYHRERSIGNNHGINRSPLINYNYIRSSPRHKKQRKKKDDSNTTPQSVQYEHAISSPAATKLNDSPFDIQSSLRRKHIYEIQQKFKSLKSPKLTYLKYLLDAGNNIHTLIPTPISTPATVKKVKSKANIYSSAPVYHVEDDNKDNDINKAKMYDDRDKLLRLSDSDEMQHHDIMEMSDSECMMQKSLSSAHHDELYQPETPIYDVNTENVSQQSMTSREISNTNSCEADIQPNIDEKILKKVSEAKEEDETEAIIDDVECEENKVLTRNFIEEILNGKEKQEEKRKMSETENNSLDTSCYDEGNDTLMTVDEDDNLAQTVSMLDSRKKRYNKKWYDNHILLLKSNPNLLFGDIGNDAIPTNKGLINSVPSKKDNKRNKNNGHSRTLSRDNTPRIGINSRNNYHGSNAQNDINVKRLYRKLTKNYDSKFMLKTWKFWHLWIIEFFSSFVLLFTVTEWKSFGEDYLKIHDYTYLTMVFGFAYTFGIFGHLFYGYLFDNYVKNKILYLALNMNTRKIDILRYRKYWRDIEIVIGFMLHLILSFVYGFLYIWCRYWHHPYDELIYLISSILIFICLGCDVILIPIVILDDFGYQYAHRNVSLLYTAFLPSVVLITFVTDNKKLENNYDDTINFPNCIAICSILSIISYILCVLFARLNSNYLGNEYIKTLSGNLISIRTNNSCCCWRCICCCFCLCNKSYYHQEKRNSIYKVQSTYFVNNTMKQNDNGNDVTPSLSQHLLQHGHDHNDNNNESPLYATK